MRTKRRINVSMLKRFTIQRWSAFAVLEWKYSWKCDTIPVYRNEGRLGGFQKTGYMAEMRKLVGHRTIIQCAASIICVDQDGRMLLGRRSDNHK